MNNEKTKFVRQVAKVDLVYTLSVFGVAYQSRYRYSGPAWSWSALGPVYS
jgi:hypothetical protein